MMFFRNILKRIGDIESMLKTRFFEWEKRISFLEENIPDREKVYSKLHEVDTVVECRLQVLEVKVQERLNLFYKEFTDKYFSSLESMLRWNKELSLLTCLKDEGFQKLKGELVKPLMDQKWAVTQAEIAEKINAILKTKGEEIRKLRGEIKENMLVAEREGRNDDTIKYRAQKDLLDRVFGFTD